MAAARCTTRSSNLPARLGCPAPASSEVCRASAAPGAGTPQAGPGDGLPVIIQVVGGAAQVEAFLPTLGPLIRSGLVIVSPVFAVRQLARVDQT